MSLSRKIEISDFSAGLITDLDSAELPLSASSRLENADVRNKKLETQPGVLEVNTGLNASFIKLSEEQFKFTSPSEQNCVLVHGTLSGVHKLYIRPYISLAGAWVDSWIELTERETSLTADAGTNTTTIVDAGLSSTTDDYYNGWIVYNSTRTTAAIVTDYVGSTKTLSLSWAIASQTTGDSYFICRNPLYKTDGTSIFAPSSSGCRFLQRDNSIEIVTGGDAIYDAQDTPSKTDLFLTVLNGHQALNDTDLNFTGFYLTRKTPAVTHPGDGTSSFQILSAAVVAASEIALTDGTYIVLPVPVYDGFQEAPRWKGVSPFDGTKYAGSGYDTITVSAGNKKIQVNLGISYAKEAGGIETPLLTPDKDGQDVQQHLVFDRRITGIRIYMAAARIVSASNYEPTGEFRFIEEVKINSSSWTVSSGSYHTYAVFYITKDKFDANQGVDISDRHGHDSLKIHANANFIASTGESVAVANVYADEKRQSFVFFAAKNSDGLVTPDVIPHTSYQNLSTFGIPAIKAFVESLGFYIAFGENILVKIDGGTFGVDNNIQAYGTSSANAVKNVNRLIYFAGLDDCFYYHPLQNVVRSLMTGFVREAWRALSTSDKQAAAIGFDGRYNVLVIAAGTQIYTYNLPASFASDLAQDTQAVGSWNVYSVSKTFLKFYTDLTKRCIGIASDGKSYEIFSSGVANTMVYEKVIGESNLNLHSLRLTYEATATVTAKIFDMARNETYPVQTFKFPAQSKHRRIDVHRGAQVRRPKLQISASVGTKISQLVINPAPISDEK